MLKIFRRKPLAPLKEALHHIRQADEIIMAHKRNKDYMLTEKDLNFIEHIEEALRHSAAATSYVHRCLSQRRDGKPEGAKKFTDSEVFDWHYPIK